MPSTNFIAYDDSTDVPVQPVNLLKLNRTYEKTGQTSVILAAPSVVHFAGFSPDSTLEQVVRLTNISSTATHVMVLPPDSGVFKVIHHQTAGAIAPGLDVQLVVQFSSPELRYHYDCIRVHTQGGGLLIPLHAYPSINKVSLLRQIDFGQVAVGETAVKRLQLSCQVPLEFTFTVTILKHNSSFDVQPLAGTVPAGNATHITISFAPTELTTEELQIQVLVSEFNAQPRKVTVTGSAVPGLARDRLVAEATRGQAGTPELAHGAAGELRSTRADGRIKPGTVSDIANVTQRGSRRRLSSLTGHINSIMQSSLPHTAVAGKHANEAAVQLGGVYFPSTLSTQHDVNTVLNQSPGKLRTKDINVSSTVHSNSSNMQCDTVCCWDITSTGT
eukprot:GHRR01016461.1.p1 GENE.GHRR01016461.1~~GHRR01016461.1.p1  ORF type:complete len:388 (+),score=120.53 GHRR01016461.1:480-1643(+)